ncbi:pilus assembly protein TadG-related protein [Streptomyces sp. NPDC006368]|uniref:pilus assembly protein TadG-related protein n=1 Tax=Streptomyces sp. NPDC006368 TaxID=3156760 RepID=UPI0033BB4C91
MSACKRGDAGQAFPIYIMMVVGLLFLAFAFFAVGQATVTRNGAQGAADAAALAAAQDARDQMAPGLLASIFAPGGIEEFLRGNKFGTAAACAQAQAFAAKNRADVVDVDGSGDGGCSRDPGFLRDEFTVEIKTRYTVGKSVIPGTERQHGTAKSTAVIEFRCSMKPDGEPNTPGEDTDEDEEEGNETPGPAELTCDGQDLVIEPGIPLPSLQLQKIFTVHLID